MKVLVLFTVFLATIPLQAKGSSSIPFNEPVFIANEGQWDDGSLFHFQGDQLQAIFFNDRIRYTAYQAIGNVDSTKKAPGAFTLQNPKRYKAQVWEIQFVGGTNNYLYQGTEKAPSVYGFLNENTAGKILYPLQYRKLSLLNLYPGVSSLFEVLDGQLKVNYLFEKASSLCEFKLKIIGFDSCRVTENGTIELSSRYGIIRDKIPASYILKDNVAGQEINILYNQLAPEIFSLYTNNIVPLEASILVDPMYLDYATYFHANTGTTEVRAIELDQFDCTYITGKTNEKFPGTPGTYDTIYSGWNDGFVAKISSDGKSLVYFIYLGGSESDYCSFMDYSDSFGLFIAGGTGSSDFPLTSGVLHPKWSGNQGPEYFIMHIDRNGRSLLYSTLMYGNIQQIKADDSGRVYLGIYGDIPYSETHDINPSGSVGDYADIHLLRLDASASAILDHIRIKGNSDDVINNLFIGTNCKAYIAGTTRSTNLPVIAGTNNFGGSFKGGNSTPSFNTDGFYFVIDSAFTRIENGKYIGTSETDYVHAITTNAAGDVYLSGSAAKDELPRATNKFQALSSLSYLPTAFILKMNTSGNYPAWLTYIYGAQWYFPEIYVSAKGDCYFTGEARFPILQVTPDAFQDTFTPLGSSYLGQVSSTGKISYLTYFGGDGFDSPINNCIKPNKCYINIAICGSTTSSDLPRKNALVNAPSRSFICKWTDTLHLNPIDLGSDKSYCDSIRTYLDGGNPGAEYNWNTGERTQIIQINKPGRYIVRETYGCETRSDTIDLRTVASAKLWMPDDTLVCDKDYVQLDAKNDSIVGIKYLWSTGDTTREINVTKSGLYMLGMTTPVCGLRNDSIRVTRLYTPASGILQNDTLLCYPFQFELSCGSDSLEAIYQWNTQDTSRNIFIGKGGTFRVTMTNSCGQLNDSIVIKTDTVPTAHYAIDTTLCDQDSFLVVYHKSSSNTTILWSDGYALSKDRMLRQSGEWLVEVKNQCFGYVDTVKVRMLNKPKELNMTDIWLCDDTMSSISISQDSNESYMWSNGDTGSIMHSQDTGLHWVAAINTCGIFIDSFNIYRGKSPDIRLPSDTVICDTKSYLLIPLITSDYEWVQWSNGNQNKNLLISESGNFTVEVGNKCGIASDSASIQMTESPNVGLPKSLHFCDQIPKPLVLTVSLSGGPSLYHWTDGDTGLVRNIVYPGKYIFTASNVCNTAIDSTTVFLTMSPKPNIGNDTTLCPPFVKRLSAGNSWQKQLWNNGQRTPSILIDETGIYSILVADSWGCTGHDEITLINSCDRHFYVPTAFTPNSNNLNDFFGPVYNDIYDLHFHIYNRWGQLVFSNVHTTDRWDGRYNGIEVPNGTYIWVATYKSSDVNYRDRGVFILSR
jgi:gliding motility-associated-like protein